MYDFGSTRIEWDAVVTYCGSVKIILCLILKMKIDILLTLNKGYVKYFFYCVL
jgi:hypothetical protein